MFPAPGSRFRWFVGDSVRFTIQDREGRRPADGWRALLRTNLGRGAQLRQEILQAHTRGLPLAGQSWRDVPMRPEGPGWFQQIPLAEAGYFKAKAYLVDPRGWQHWPEGPDVAFSVHPDRYRTGNIIYCAFARLFGPTRTAGQALDPEQEKEIQPLDRTGYTVIPPSGTLRDLTAQLPHIFGALGARILQLLPVNPTPTTYARFGRFGSPYAALNLTTIDPALVVFDKRTTGVDQFRELTYQAHLRGGRVFLDIVINHTGWGSILQDNYPEWFVRNPDGTFASPGAWGVVWEDLVELHHQNVALWDELADVFLTWCRRGVDGFRCDAGYKVPVAAWQYIVARVQQEYPETLFLLEGLGGAWEATEALLTEGGMQWAYSELFQNYSGAQVASYLDHSFRQSERTGLLVHYSETHDNERLATRGRTWSLLRNRLCALTSVSGGFGFTCGVEWAASEKILVHGSTGLSWGCQDNLIPELAKLDQLLNHHPCFFDGAKVTRLSPADSPVYALLRQSADAKDRVVVLLNTDIAHARSLPLDAGSNAIPDPGSWVDLLGQEPPKVTSGGRGKWLVQLAPGAACCLAHTPAPVGLHGEAYRRARAQAAWGLAAISRLLPLENTVEIDWRALAAAVNRSPSEFLATIAHWAEQPGCVNLSLALSRPSAAFSKVISWSLPDRRRVTPVPPGHWLLVQDTVPFRAMLRCALGPPVQNVESIAVDAGQVACFPPLECACDAELLLERYAPADPHVQAAMRFLSSQPAAASPGRPDARLVLSATDIILLTNGRGGMARICVDVGRVLSKYDCVLGANLHPRVPVDRHIFVKRIRVWVNADGFISPLDFRSLASVEPGAPAVWHFVANAGDGRTVEIEIGTEMLPGRNTTVFHFRRPTSAQASGKQLPDEADVRLSVRLDIEDRNFHWETKRNGGAEYHFSVHTRAIRRLHASSSPEIHGAEESGFRGFAFTPAAERQLRVFATGGWYHPEPEWSATSHPVEQSRGQVGGGDAYSPGWFELPLKKGAEVTLLATAEEPGPEAPELTMSHSGFLTLSAEPSPPRDPFYQQLRRAVRAFVVQRENGKTVIAGYPWFLDWGRDSFICARGLLAGGMLEEVRDLLVTFARFERQGTLPNSIFGEDASNRDTSDAPLWFGLASEELAERTEPLARIPVGAGGNLRDVLENIARNYVKGTPNGIRMDPDSGLVWSPAHFTWMDTNYPASSPREGYPVDIQALWIRLLLCLANAGSTVAGQWRELAQKTQASLEKLFWHEDSGYYSDCLLARKGQSAAQAVVDDALRSNSLLLVSLGLVQGDRAKRTVAAALKYLVIPGALRSLAPLPVSVPLPIYGKEGRLLNDPRNPYWGHYEGDEDTRRKPAYHNGTAWSWTFPGFCVALARAWDFAPPALAAAKAYLGSMAGLMSQGCLGQIPEILDGDAPHAQRGCDAQAWGATEALRVWKLLVEAQTNPPTPCGPPLPR